ncbi:MAG: type 2 lanthipeptide synthetase LanM family protein [Chloroflexota bacterium]|nr:type 2 lanthipeptide synthetase LanM family protein [Chloroflexota bacterium]
MDSSLFTSPSWGQALTLSERAALLFGDGVAPYDGERDKASGERRLERWRAQWPFGEEAFLQQRLALDSLDEGRFQEILGTPAQAYQVHMGDTGRRPDWLAALADAYSGPASAYAGYLPGEEMLGFLDLIQPMIDQACARLRAGFADLAQRYAAPPFDPGIIEDIFLMNLPDPLLMRLGRTMALELNVARLQGMLDGETPTERFASFLDGLRRPERSAEILAEYPVLARQLWLCLMRWADVSLEFLSRLCEDWSSIREVFSLTEDPGPLVELLGGAGDTHRGGRSVMVAEFESGFRIVYKPKSLAIDAHFQDLLEQVNEWGCTPPLRTMIILDRGEYGWVEFVAQSECSSVTEIERFYQRHGAYLALLYALNSTDFHLENIIAAGEHPMLIDLETLFNSLSDAFDVTVADAAAQKAMSESVMQVGMLPIRIWSGEEYDGIDISGLGGSPGQLSPDRIPEPAEAGTDAMHFVRRRFEMPGDANRPSLEGQETSAVDYVDNIVAGFAGMYRLLRAHKRDLLAEDGPLAQFAEDEIRILIRPTRSYAQLLFESFHPDLLRDAIDRDLFLDRLWVATPARPYLAEVIAAERDDILVGDIPLFTSKPTTRDLYGAQGQVISGVLSDTGMAIVRRRVLALSEHDMRRQTWMIRASLGTLAPGIDRPPAMTHQLDDGNGGELRQRLLNAARGIADHLAASAIYGEEDAAWIGLEPMGEQYWSITPLGNDLYNGTPGIALYMAYAGRVLGEERYTELARRAWRTVWLHAELLRPGLPEIGAFEGWGGVLYTLTHLAVLWDDETVREQAAQVVETLAGFIERNDTYDVVRGSAGAIAALLAYHRRFPSDAAVAAAIACGDQLVASALPMASGAGWRIRRHGETPLAGFSHGAAGIAWALLALSEETGDERYREIARKAIAYERSLFSAETGNWSDLRTVDDDADAAPARTVTAWCHGATGIGLARLHSLDRLDDPALVDEVQIALDTTLREGFGHTHALCHGDMGALDVLLEASQVLGDNRWRDASHRLAGKILTSIERSGWQCGGPPGVEMPGLMLGLAGIGYGMLRLAEPAQVPCVLRLAPPLA